MKHFIDNLVLSAIKEKKKKSHKLSIRIEEKCPWSPYQKWWYVIGRENGGEIYLFCDWTSVRNLLFHLHFFAIGQKMEKWTSAEDFYNSSKI